MDKQRHLFVHKSPELDAVGDTLSTLKFAEWVDIVELGAAQANKESSNVNNLKEQVWKYPYACHIYWKWFVFLEAKIINHITFSDCQSVWHRKKAKKKASCSKETNNKNKQHWGNCHSQHLKIINKRNSIISLTSIIIVLFYRGVHAWYLKTDKSANCLQDFNC